MSCAVVNCLMSSLFWITVSCETSSKCSIDKWNRWSGFIMTCQVNMLNSCRSQHVQSCRNEPFLLHPKFSPSSRFHITIFRPSTAPSLMAFVQVDVDLQTLFQPLLASQRELMRAIEIICQIDDLSDFTEDVELQAATAHLRLVRQTVGSSVRRPSIAPHHPHGPIGTSIQGTFQTPRTRSPSSTWIFDDLLLLGTYNFSHALAYPPP